jgi:hypothetical protein
MAVQSVVFPKAKFSLVSALKWLREHNMKAEKVDVTPHTFRFRQMVPHFPRYYTQVLPNGVELVVGTK